MALIRFFFQLAIFIGVLASVAAIVLAVTLVVRYPPVLVIVGIACLLFYGLLKQQPNIG